MSKALREATVIRGVAMRALNRRVEGFLMADGTIQFRFKRLMSDRSIHVSRIRLTLDAVKAMGEIMIRLSEPNAEHHARPEAKRKDVA